MNKMLFACLNISYSFHNILPQKWVLSLKYTHVFDNVYAERTKVDGLDSVSSL